MIRGLAVILLAGLVLSACGSISATKAMSSWVSDSGYHTSSKRLVVDARHAVTALGETAMTTNGLHTVCGVLDEETEQANSSLPTPDDQATHLLARAYNTLGAGANICYNAGARLRKRARAIADLQKAVGLLAEGTTRVASVTTP